VARHVVWLRFRDGTSGEIDLAPALRGPIFEPLRNPAVFSQFQIHPDFHTLVWPNGTDFAPEFLRDNVRVTVSCPLVQLVPQSTLPRVSGPRSRPVATGAPPRTFAYPLVHVVFTLPRRLAPPIDLDLPVEQPCRRTGKAPIRVVDPGNGNSGEVVQ
jgi:hypothetical protein